MIEFNNILRLLDEYELASGQQVNLDKSSIYFSADITASVPYGILHNLDIQNNSGIDKYLGVPLIYGNSKKKHLMPLKDRMITKIWG